MTALAVAPSAVTVEQHGRWLIVRFSSEHDVLSWAVVCGGRRRARAVAWYQVHDSDLRPPVDAVSLLEERMRQAPLAGAVGLMTSRRLDTFSDVTSEWGGLSARAIATVGLGNALSVGDPPGAAGRIGTVNVMCHISVALTEEAQLEAVSVAVEARTVAILESGVKSTLTDRAATGTGTDCLVIASPAGTARAARYAGKHTEVGHAIGACVRSAVAAGARNWVEGRRR